MPIQQDGENGSVNSVSVHSTYVSKAVAVPEEDVESGILLYQPNCNIQSSDIEARFRGWHDGFFPTVLILGGWLGPGPSGAVAASALLFKAA